MFPFQVPVAQPDIIYHWSVRYIPSTFPLNNMAFPWLFISKVPLSLVILHQILQSPIHPPRKMLPHLHASRHIQKIHVYIFVYSTCTCILCTYIPINTCIHVHINKHILYISRYIFLKKKTYIKTFTYTNNYSYIHV